MDGDPKWVDVIERDLHRQFPFHEMFVSRGGHGLVFLSKMCILVCCVNILQSSTLTLMMVCVLEQATGSLPGVEGIHPVQTRGGLLPGSGSYSSSASHAHAGRGKQQPPWSKPHQCEYYDALLGVGDLMIVMDPIDVNNLLWVVIFSKVQNKHILFQSK